MSCSCLWKQEKNEHSDVHLPFSSAKWRIFDDFQDLRVVISAGELWTDRALQPNSTCDENENDGNVCEWSQNLVAGRFTYEPEIHFRNDMRMFFIFSNGLLFVAMSLEKIKSMRGEKCPFNAFSGLTSRRFQTHLLCTLTHGYRVGGKVRENVKRKVQEWDSIKQRLSFTRLWILQPQGF